ncbi:helix-turn-helix domain-containing protein [Nonomuraea basaltis]|uniref:helix-turn-helix domain-containing protein n=1 Tax=Nonomuraea basaltis TaxID=2495887 RepID=UPI00110C3F16|nr:helix-turn-helix transcriptional regulator [Nonomuraea basaltis]TMR95581.1 helix-turn-helix transcriptional regulator [Nonomuraea basaltis]
MANRPIDLGPTGKRVADNVAALRKSLGLDQRQLSERMEALGRPMQPSVISKIEKGDRRIDADDLMALALALDVTPNRLLFTGNADDEQIRLTPKAPLEARNAWYWAVGDRPLPNIWSDRPQLIDDEREARFHRESRPQYPRQLDVDTIIHKRDVLNAVLDALDAAEEGGVAPNQAVEYVRRVKDGWFPRHNLPKPKYTPKPGEKRQSLEEILAELRSEEEDQ